MIKQSILLQAALKCKSENIINPVYACHDDAWFHTAYLLLRFMMINANMTIFLSDLIFAARGLHYNNNNLIVLALCPIVSWILTDIHLIWKWNFVSVEFYVLFVLVFSLNLTISVDLFIHSIIYVWINIRDIFSNNSFIFLFHF